MSVRAITHDKKQKLALSNRALSIIATARSSERRSKAFRHPLVGTNKATLHDSSSLARLSKLDFGNDIRIIHNGTAVVAHPIFNLRSGALLVRTGALRRFRDVGGDFTRNGRRSSDLSLISQRIWRPRWRNRRTSTHCDGREVESIVPGYPATSKFPARK